VLAGTQSDWAVVDQVAPPNTFQGGYQDFIPFDTPENVMLTSGPPKTSAFDDLCYYFEHHSNCLQLSRQPESCTVFMLKLVASEYVQLIQYIHTLLSHLAWLLSRRQTFHDFQISWVEECWSDLIALQRRIDDYRRNVGAICLSLRSSNAWQASGGWTNPIPDFLFIDEQLRDMKEKSESLVAIFSGLAGIIANRRSLLEARGASALALVGTIFVPMSLIASILSLPNNYQPGGPRFYQYWAISIPLICVVYASIMWYLKRHIRPLH
jgi:Mg2+ and Co2+ transporter CorA